MNSVKQKGKGAEVLDLARGDIERIRIMLGLLESVEQQSAPSQRHLAAELGIAVGLVNAYLKRCIRKGLLKARQAPARRYAYYLTPQGMAEKSRLTVEYLSHSLSFFRRARVDCANVLAEARAKGWSRMVLAGASDLAEISLLCALECGIEIVAVVDARAPMKAVGSCKVVKSFDDVTGSFDGILVTAVESSAETFVALNDRFGPDRVLAPAMLKVGVRLAG